MPEGTDVRRSLLLGAVLTPLVAAIAYELLLLSDNDIGKYYTTHELVEGFFFGLVPASYAICWGLGAPVVFLLKKSGRLRLWTVTVAGGSVALVALGVVVFAKALTASGFHWESLQWRSALTPIAGVMLFGAFVGSAFCMISGITRRFIGRQKG